MMDSNDSEEELENQIPNEEHQILWWKVISVTFSLGSR